MGDSQDNRKVAIEAKLAKEENAMKAIRQSLAKSNQLTDGMVNILTTFDSRLEKLESVIKPVYGEIVVLQKRNKNIETTQHYLQKVKGYYTLGDRAESVIEYGAEALEPFLATLTELHESVLYFKDNFLHASSELQIQTVLLEKGTDALSTRFKVLLERYSNPVGGQVLLDCVLDSTVTDEGDEMDTITEQDSVSDETASSRSDLKLHLSEQARSELVDISTWLSKYLTNSDHLTVYAQIRSDTMISSLKNLKNQLKSGTGGSGNSVGYSPVVISRPKGKNETPLKFLKMQIGGGKSTSALKSFSPLPPTGGSAEHSHKKSATLSLSNVFSTAPDQEVVDVDVTMYVYCITAFAKLVKAEMEFMVDIIPEDKKMITLDHIVQRPLHSLINEGEQVEAMTRRAAADHTFSVVLLLCQVVRHLRQYQLIFRTLLQGCTQPTQSSFPRLIQLLGAAGAYTLNCLFESIRDDSEKTSKPKDGTVHELTSNLMTFLDQLRVYSATVGAMLLAQDPTLQRTLSFDLKSQAVSAFIEYVRKLLGALGLNLSNKAETYTDQTLRSVFMLNNTNYILNSLRSSHLLELISKRHREITAEYEKQITEHRIHYMQCFVRLLQFIQEDPATYMERIDSSKLKDRDRQNIKDRFTGFNKEIEDQVRIQKQYSFPDYELREMLRKQTKNHILPVYKLFRNKYLATAFTRNINKYAKYTAEQVSQMLDSIYDSAT